MPSTAQTSDESTSLFHQRRHYEAPAVRWNKRTVMATIKMVADEVIAQAESGEKWKKHRIDEGGQPKADFYFGRAGSLWAIDYLQRSGALKSRFDISAYLEPLLAENRKYRKRLVHSENSSYFFGEMPILLMQYRLHATKEKADEITAAIEENNTQPVRELMWGMAGSMLVALFMFEWTAEKRWATLYRRQVKLMLADWEKVKDVGYLWNIDLYGKKNYLLGPVHGFSGNALALIKGFELLPEKQVTQITRRVIETTINTAQSTSQHTNWWPGLHSDKSARKRPLIQFCHGAPGMIIALAAIPANLNHEFDELLLKGGELIWDAGLLEKGPNLCHGTSGNGYAFLKLYQRTGDELWLKRARSYAMQSIGQYHEIKTRYKTTRFPFWTGDPGMAIYLWDCINATTDFPTLDVF